MQERFAAAPKTCSAFQEDFTISSGKGPQDTHSALQQFAREEGTNQDEAAAILIEEALTGRGLLEE